MSEVFKDPKTRAAGMPAVADVGQLLAALKDSLQPSQREWAVEGLAKVNWRSNREVVPALLTAVREDPAYLVRLSCVKALVKMKATEPAVFSTLETLKADDDARVRQEAEQALGTLTALKKRPG